MQILPSKRWLVVHNHDGSPVDAGMFANKAQAIKMKNAMNRPEKYRVEKAAIMSASMAERLLS